MDTTKSIALGTTRWKYEKVQERAKHINLSSFKERYDFTTTAVVQLAADPPSTTVIDVHG